MPLKLDDVIYSSLCLFVWNCYINCVVEMQILLRSFLTTWNTVLLEKPTSYQLGNKFPALCETRRSITAFSRAPYLSLSWARLIQFMHFHPTSRRSILILSSHLRLGLPNSLLPSRLPSKPLYAPLLSPHTCCMSRPSHSSRFDQTNNIWWVQISKLLRCGLD